MKLKNGEKVYLQKYDVAFITHELHCVPADIFEEIFGTESGIFIMSGSEDSLRFECVFERPGSIQWLMSQDWIIDYDKYAEMPLTDLEELVKRLQSKNSADIKAFNSKNETYRGEHYPEAKDKFDKSGHKIASLCYILGARKGKYKFTFPDQCQRKIQKEPSFFKRLFSRSAQ